MPNYKIMWTIELSADTPYQAAEEALHSIAFGTAKVFTVIEEGDLDGVDIDLCHTQDFNDNT